MTRHDSRARGSSEVDPHHDATERWLADLGEASVDEHALGVIVMLLGVVALGWTLYAMQRGATRIVRYRRVPRHRQVYDETTRRRVYDDRPPA